MNSNLTWKLAFIAGIAVIAAFFSFPPKERINLGLDLSGGAHIVMQVQTESALDREAGLAGDRIADALHKDNYSGTVVAEGTVVRVRGTDTARASEVRAIFDTFVRNPDWRINSAGAGAFDIAMSDGLKDFLRKSSVDQTIRSIRQRIDSLGVSEPTIHQQGVDRILVQLPGVEDPERIKMILQDPALLDWKEVVFPAREEAVPALSEENLLAAFGGELPADAAMFIEDRRDPVSGTVTRLYWPLKRVSAVVGDDLRDASRGADQWGNPNISFELEQDAAVRFEEATLRNIQKPMAIVLGSSTDKKVISAPIIQSAIRDQGQITGDYTIDEAEDLALKLRSGSFPTEVDIIEERVVGPSLGQDSIQAGMKSGLVGFGLVLLFMVVYYRLSGFNAIIVLAMNVLIVFGTLGALPILTASGVEATLTLPGIAGMILTIGMAVDANVLIFERIREELKLGKTVRSAVEQGFGRAFTTILDCNITTLVAAFFLFTYGTGPVQGFAVTLTIGLLASMFTAVFVSRQFFEFELSRKTSNDSLSI